MFWCRYSTEVSGHYGKSLKDNALLFLVICGGCVFVLFSLGLFVLIWVFFWPPTGSQLWSSSVAAGSDVPLDTLPTGWVGFSGCPLCLA